MVITSKQNTKIAFKRSQVKIKCHQLPNTSSTHHETHSYQVTSVSDQQFPRVSADRQTHRQTPPKTIAARIMDGAQVMTSTHVAISSQLRRTCTDFN